MKETELDRMGRLGTRRLILFLALVITVFMLLPVACTPMPTDGTPSAENYPTGVQIWKKGDGVHIKNTDHNGTVINECKVQDSKCVVVVRLSTTLDEKEFIPEELEYIR